ncbi:MAG: 50S ribosomal protein L9 [Spirochaetia bacterium]|nr:50S ribosomal protein L9 [Spirochaetia bacterium]MDY3887049.1 50S ribosomal protein L9 [Treponema sp.]MCI6827592.1 50S ribosomal protein L9 [Spirochaetia bacterium]MCI7564277.1 50S ribosomal protein L9 [Spirochaetia bacterium]MCI7798512.1 50S ribosomal protein L9 [Spirochaetia bacterium]
MKVILNEDVKYLGEEGDVKNVANGYARNFLLPRGLVVPYNDATVAIFEARKADIEARKEVKRQNARSLKEKLESASFEIVMPAGNNGKLYGAVTTTVIADLLEKQGFEIEKKRIDIPGLAIKSVGNYHATIKLYESQTAEIKFVVKAQETEEKVSGKKSEKKAEVEPEKTEEKTE